MTDITVEVDTLSLIRHCYPTSKQRDRTELRIDYKDRVETYEGHITYRNVPPTMKYDLTKSKSRCYYAVDKVKQKPDTIELYLGHGIKVILNGAKLVKTEKFDDES